MPTKILVDVVNDLMSTNEPTIEQLKDKFRICCRALKHLSQDNEFIDELRKQQADPHEISKIIDDIAKFDKFWDLERGLLRDAGVTEEATKALIKEGKKFISQLSSFKSDPDALLVGINKIRNQTCEVADQLTSIENDQMKKNKLKKILKGAFLGIGGAFVIKVNLVSAATLGVGGVYISSVVGEQIVKSAEKILNGQ